MTREEVKKRANDNESIPYNGEGVAVDFAIEISNAQLDEAIGKLRGIKLSDNQRFEIISTIESLKLT